MRYKILGSTGYTVNLPKIISLDTEYSEKNVRKAKLLSISIGVSEIMTYILDDFSQVQRFLDAADIIFTWNGVVDFFILEKNGFKVNKSKMVDAMLMEHLIDERLDHGLGDFALREFNDNYKEEFWSKYQTYQEVPKEIAYEYEKRDGCYTFIAGTKYLKQLSSKLELIRHVHRLQWALFDTEIKGIKVDLELMRKTKLEMGSRIETYLPKLRDEFDDYCKIWEMKKWSEEISKRSSDKGKLGVPKPTFKFSSDTQLKTLLYDETYLNLPIKQKTKKGSPSTSYDSLKELGEDYPEISTIVQYKEEKAVYSTFVEGMLEKVENDQRIYPGFFINGTATGRISHNNPNLANLPKEGIIRNFFIPDNGHVLIGADFGQLEVVIEANITEDPNLIKIITEGASKHDIFKADLDSQGFNLDRGQVKNVNFALQYDAQAFKISKMVGCSVEDAQKIIDQFYKTFEGVKRKKDEIKRLIDSGEPIVSLFGRERHFPKKFENKYDQFKAYRQAYNHIIQSTGADMTNRATWMVSERLKKDGIGRLLWSVHDEIITEIKQDSIDKAKSIIVELMEESNYYLGFKYHAKAIPYGPLIAWSKT